MHPISSLFAGALLCNALPHLVAGLQGMPFPTPFAKPHGVGDSSPVVNFAWGFANLLAGLALLGWHPVNVGMNGDFAILLAGAFALGVLMARHFGKVRGTGNAKL